jgi:hypothetical protein
MTVANFIIAGTEKAGTTSAFSYLARHPEVAASRRKETDFFRSDGGRVADYAACFPSADGRPVVMEASPGYLGEAEQVVPRMQAMVPDVKLLFILREPVARFLSSYHFHRARLNLPQQLAFREYLDACIEYAEAHAGERARVVRQKNIDEWFLKVLPFGCYARHLVRYFDAFPRHHILVAFYDDLLADPRTFMENVSEFLGIDRTFWASADFKPVNVTFSGRSRYLHRAAVLVNDTLEPLLRPRPRLKSAVVGAYKRLNRAREGYENMSAGDRELLEAFYAPHNRDLETLLDRPLPPGWSLGRDETANSWQLDGQRMLTR